MSSRSPKQQSSLPSSKKHGSSSRHQKKNDDWKDVTEPEERRRIQNRIAQRKFREKAREQKERQERESRNQEHAGSAYQIPVASDFAVQEESVSGLPWGGINIRHMVARGHESESRRGSRWESETNYAARVSGNVYSDDAQLQQLLASPSTSYSPYGVGYAATPQAGSWDGGSGDDRYFDDLSPSHFSFDYDCLSGDGSSSSR